MLSNEDRGMYGYEAVRAGSPDFGKNGDDPDGVFTDAGDAVANILHHVFQASKADSLDEREAFALGVLTRAEMHFKAELRRCLMDPNRLPTHGNTERESEDQSWPLTWQSPLRSWRR